MDPASFDWTPLANHPGVASKHLGEFSERRTKIAMYQILPGATLPLADNSIYFAIRGSGSVCATGQGTPRAIAFTPRASIHIPAGDRATATAQGSHPVELLHIALPRFS